MNEFEIKNGWLRVWGQFREVHIRLKNLRAYEYEEVTADDGEHGAAFQLVTHRNDTDKVFLPLEPGRKLLEQLYVAVRQDDCC